MADTKSRGGLHIQAGLIVLAGAVLLCALLVHVPTFPVNIPIGLRSNARESVTFQADYTSPYAIDVSMDAKKAARVYPCLDPERVANACKPEPTIDLRFQLLEDGRDISRQISINPPSVEAEYTRDKYVHFIGSVDLDRGKKYTLIIRSNADAASLQPADPHLEIAVATSTIMSDMILRFVVEGICCLLILIGLIWAAVSLVFGWKPSPTVK